MNLRRHIAAAVVCTATVLAACSPQNQPEATTATANNSLGPDTITASDGTQIPESLYRYYVQNGLQKAPEELSEQERNAVLENLVSLQLLSDAAEKKGLPQERTIAVQLALQRVQLLARAMIQRYVEENPASEAELRAAYEERLPSLGATQFKARHILLETEDDAKSVIEDLNKGADFAELAKERSTGPTGPQGGDLGWFTAESMVAPFSEAVQGMEVGSYTSEPVQTQFGWHVILLEDRKDNQPPGLDAVRDEMTNVVNQQKVEAYVESLKNSASGQETADE